MTVALTIGLLTVLVFYADAFKTQATVSAGVDLALGQLLLAAGGLIATKRLHGRRKEFSMGFRRRVRRRALVA